MWPLCFCLPQELWWIHDLHSTKASAVIPLDAKSAKFSFVPINLHRVTMVFSLMIEILLATNVRNLVCSFAMYFNTDWLSVQNVEMLSLMSNYFLSILSTLTAKTAATSSRRGIVVCFIGATLAVPSIKATCTVCLPAVNLR